MKMVSQTTTKVVFVTAATLVGAQSFAQPRFHHLHGGEINGLFFVNSQRGWTAEDGTRIRRTDDGGTSWILEEVDTSNLETRVELKNIFFTDTLNGWAVGNEGVVLRSTDGGLTWTDANPSDRVVNQSTAMGACESVKAELFDIFMISTSVGFVVGDDGALQKTTDGGLSWSFVTNPPSAFACGSDPDDGYAIHFFQNSGTGFAAYSKGLIAGDHNRLWRTLDSGETWTEVALPNTTVSPVACPPTSGTENVEVWSIAFEDPLDYNSPA